MGREFWSPGTQSMDPGTGDRLWVGMSLWPYRYPGGWRQGCNWKRVREGPLWRQNRGSHCLGQRVTLPSTALRSLPERSWGALGPSCSPSLPKQPCLPLWSGMSQCKSPASARGVVGCPWLPGFAQKRGESAAAPARSRQPGVCEEDSRSAQSV